MPKKKVYQDKSPVRLPGQNKFNFQGYFLHYLNKNAPELFIKAKKLAPMCREIFGEFPDPIETVNDQEGLGVWFKFKNQEKKQSYLNSIVNSVFTNCIWKAERDNSNCNGCIKILFEKSECSSLLKLAINSSKLALILSEEVKRLGGLVEDYGMDSNTVDYYQLQKVNSANFKYLTENIKVDKRVKAFQQAFDELLSEFYLNKKWLARSLFLTIWRETEKLQMELNYKEKIPHRVTKSVAKEIGRERELRLNLFEDLIYTSTDYDALLLEYGPEPLDYGAPIPLPSPFTYSKIYSINNSFEEYEKEAVESYKEHLRSYFAVILKVLNNHGYKQKKGNTLKYQRLEWLIIWNKSNVKYLWEIIHHIPDFENIDIGKYQDRKRVEKTLELAFKEFRKFDLPVRPFGKLEKKITS